MELGGSFPIPKELKTRLSPDPDEFRSYPNIIFL
jgi:hypothetical protein